MVFETLQSNVVTAQAAVRKLAAALPSRDGCGCRNALDSALVTRPDAISAANLERLKPILGRRLGAQA
jgi:hypothetical protein